MEHIFKKYNYFLKSNESNYFSFIAMTILIGSIWGGLAAMLIDKNNAPVWQLALNVSFSMLSNVIAIGQAPFKWMFNIFLFTMLINTVLMLMNIF
ncbi:MAG: hypothetical protein ACK452_13425 [Bacteroidota bacterium]|jgi:hypothetical protein